MPWVVVHGSTGGNKQNNSLSSMLEEAFLSHWLFKCTRSVCVCTYTFYMSLSLRVDSAHSQQSAAANDSLCCMSDTSQLIWDSSPVSTHTWWRVQEAAGYKKAILLSWNINMRLCGDPSIFQDAGNWKDRVLWRAGGRELLWRAWEAALCTSPPHDV